MKIKDYGKICSNETIEVLKNSMDFVISNYKMKGTYWMSINKKPKNNIENFILKTFNLYFSKIDKKSVAGIEWWYRTSNYKVQDCNEKQKIVLHFDFDEDIYASKNIVISPLGCSITYLTNTKNGPTIITNVESTGPKTHFPELPTEIVYSHPGEGKFLTFDPKYLHGIGETEECRLTLLYNIWNYKITDARELSFSEDLDTLEIDNNKEKNINEYTGPFEYIDIDVLKMPMSVKKPSKYNLYDTYHIEL
jgi:hypothetical protein